MKPTKGQLCEAVLALHTHLFAGGYFRCSLWTEFLLSAHNSKPCIGWKQLLEVSLLIILISVRETVLPVAF